MARVYRRQIAKGLRIYVNNRAHAGGRSDLLDGERGGTPGIEGLNAKTSRLVVAKTVQIPAQRQNE